MRAELADGRVLEFPDGTSPEVVQATVRKVLGVTPAAEKPKKFDVEAFREKGWGSGAEAAAYKAGSAVAEVAGKVLPAEVAGGLGYAANVAAGAVPALLGGGAAGKIAPAAQGAASWLMQKAIKPATDDLIKGDAAKAIQTMLDEGVLATKAGMEKLRTKVAELNYEIAEKIRNSTSSVNKYEVWPAIKEKLDYFLKQGMVEKDAAKIQEGWHEFLRHPFFKGGDTLPVQSAQEIKQGIYRVQSGKYGELSSAEAETQKAVGRGLKEQIAEAVPGVAALNARESKLLNALDVSEKKILIRMNNDPAGISLASKNPAVWATWMADRSPAFKSLAAIILHKGSLRIPQAAAGAGIAATQGQEP